MNYKGEIIEESLADKSILDEVNILSSRVEQVTPRHKTPWIKKWTLHTIEVPEELIDEVATRCSRALENRKSWYIDFKNDKFHWIIFRAKVFKVDLSKPKAYQEAKRYGTSLGIPKHQVQFEKLER